jgi:hypothetical protein
MTISKTAFTIALLALCFPLTAQAQSPVQAQISAPVQAQIPTPVQAQPAPAPVQAKKPDWMKYHTPYIGEQTNINNPHRTTTEILAWSQATTSNLLTMSPTDYKLKLTEFKKYFVPQGWQDYAGFLRDTKTISMVTQEGYSINTIVNLDPVMLNHGAVAGAYHWLMQVPITVSFLITAPNGELQTSGIDKYILTLQVGRVAEGSGDNGIAIESWKVQRVTK